MRWALGVLVKGTLLRVFGGSLGLRVYVWGFWKVLSSVEALWISGVCRICRRVFVGSSGLGLTNRKLCWVCSVCFGRYGLRVAKHRVLECLPPLFLRVPFDMHSILDHKHRL